MELVLERRHHAWPDWVGEAGQAEPDEVALIMRITAAFVRGDAQDAQGAARHALIGLENSGAGVVAERNDAGAGVLMGTACEDFDRIALNAEQPPVFGRMQRAHALAPVAAQRRQQYAAPSRKAGTSTSSLMAASMSALSVGVPSMPKPCSTVRTIASLDSAATSNRRRTIAVVVSGAI